MILDDAVTDKGHETKPEHGTADAQMHLDALREILDVMGRSRSDESLVFEVILERAALLCRVDQAALQLVDPARTEFHIAAAWGYEDTAFRIGSSWPIDGPHPVPTVARTGQFEHIVDLMDHPLYAAQDPIITRIVDTEGIRSWLVMPLMQGGTAIGTLSLSRKTVLAFPDSDIELVRTFAAQAVIAIENVRQFREVQTRLEREAAAREILDVISQNQTDVQPVFEAVLRRAATLSGAPMSSINIVDEDRTQARLVAHWGEELRILEVGTTVWSLEFEDPADRYTELCMRDGIVTHCHDLKDTARYRAGEPARCAMVDTEGLRTFLAVPLMRQGQAIGNIALYRREVQPFTDDEIALIQNFAAQAVIAIENVRQFREVQTRLEREKGMAEVLSLISTSREDEAPVFEMILSQAAKLCNAHAAALALGQVGDTHQTMPASYGLDPATVKVYDDGLVSMDPELSVGAQAIVTGQTVHIRDMAETEAYKSGVPVFVSVVEETGIRTNLLVPLKTQNGAIGVLILFRKLVQPYTPDEITLVESFAAQAVIAIENVRQFKALEALNAELGTRVEQQVGEIERMGRLKRFLPAAVADTVVSQGSDDLLKSHRALLGVLFCDIRGFTAFCETAEPEETIEVLQSYHEEMGALIAEHGAGVDTRAGDGIMVLFNDPLPCDDPAGDALRLGLAMRARMAELSRTWRRHGHRLGFGVGISLGYATVGMVGSAGRFDYTASGTAVNLAARLCDQAKDGEILLSPRAYTAVEDGFAAETVGELTLKGIHAPVEVFRVVTEA